MALDKEWQDHVGGHTPLDAAALIDLEARASAAIEAATEPIAAAVEVVNLGTDWSSGESQPIFIGKDAVGSHLNIKVGSEASPDTTFGPVAKVSRTISIPESSFSGAGSLGLAAIAGVTKALSTSEGQAVGVEGGAVTASSHEGEHSNADAFGGGFVGRSTSGSNRVGGGLYATGQRNNASGRATGAEISAENNTATAGVYNPGTYSSVTGIWVAPKGTSDGGVGVVIGHPESAKFKVGFAANESSVTDSTFRDDSKAAVSLDIRGSHATAAVRIADGAGLFQIGEGTEQSSRLANPPDPLKGHILHGTAAAPNKTPGSTFKVSRWEELTRASVEAAEGVVGTDGLDSTPAILGASKGLTGTDMQATGVAGMAWTASTSAEVGNDACGVVGLGRTTGTADGVALGAYFEAQNDSTTTGKALGAEVRLRNYRASDTYNNSGPSSSMGLWINVGGECDAAAAMQVGGILGHKFDVGVGFNANSLISAGLRDDSSSERSVFIRGSHSKGAIVVNKGAGQVIIGREAPQQEVPLFEVYSESPLDPIASFGTDKGAAVSTQLARNAGGNIKAFAAAGAGNFMTGTVNGDTGLAFTAGHIFHIGASTKSSQFRIAESGIGFFGTAPQSKPEVTGSRGGNAALASLLEKLATLGLVTNGSSA